ncbi:dUTP diphosphatase [Holdemanella biformis]|uniref:dUTP diphosphatase n=1 Tax=Holdemanella biformis TaxID=1735 RepID=UPI001C25836D|nr:dUTP diphosphatase [Holdemanella biformis]MBU9894880.1 dUTP diphosphatase [Holdemanella biformis]MBV3415922.1 dUTP diphosphatase [Holdemanella biformis]
MTSKEFELIKKMLQMQAKLDKAIMKEYGLTEIDEEKLCFAILDEVGELTHELKANWCWWKKTQAPVDDNKVLGELVDVWHFVLSYQNHFINGEKGVENTCMVKRNSKNILSLMRNNEFGLTVAFSDLVSWKWNKLERLTAITEYLGFTIERVYEAYCSKNKINYQRLKEGY